MTQKHRAELDANEDGEGARDTWEIMDKIDLNPDFQQLNVGASVGSWDGSGLTAQRDTEDP